MLLRALALFALCLLVSATPSSPPPPGSCSSDADCPEAYPCCSPWGNCGNEVPWCSSPPPPPPPCKSPLYGTTSGGTPFSGSLTSTPLEGLRIISGCVVDAIQWKPSGSSWTQMYGTNSCSGCLPKPPPQAGLRGTLYEISVSSDEYIYKLSGTTGTDKTCGAGGAGEGVVSLTVHVKNMKTGVTKTYGPFGDSKSGTFFETAPGNIVSFFGYASTRSYMKGIGVIYSTCPSGSVRITPMGAFSII
ncbi:hypothetical protein SELMODRAFT_410458 [Selaginella moellendorffii]|uniref:Jacalin-type lectin domain-containing protein n=1 Tax=Selaginella moellendorffii TaxID=88036 RepID=D8RET8_SELML|nr:uncharacterized protein LOC9646688 [Selaginella moellendorffii]EFJ29719.1 hypothetical protein SELMODRAFT_410458 [Selaginella moellendorffii]|eukprot:XP_002969631.1 uncharacterized protein LOC9646688 [Selaginella moellendorffii]